MGILSAGFLLVNFNIDVVVFVLRGLYIQKVSGAYMGFVRTVVRATFHLFVLSLQIPMYENDENKNNGKLRVQKAIGYETLASPRYKGIPNQLYPQVHIVNKPMPISSKLSELLGIDPNMIYTLGKVLPNFNASAHGKTPVL